MDALAKIFIRGLCWGYIKSSERSRNSLNLVTQTILHLTDDIYGYVWDSLILLFPLQIFDRVPRESLRGMDSKYIASVTYGHQDVDDVGDLLTHLLRILEMAVGSFSSM